MADNPDELTFSEGDVIIVDGEEDQEWWVSRGAVEPVHKWGEHGGSVHKSGWSRGGGCAQDKGSPQPKQSGSAAATRLTCSAFHILWCLLCGHPPLSGPDLSSGVAGSVLHPAGPPWTGFPPLTCS